MLPKHKKRHIILKKIQLTIKIMWGTNMKKITVQDIINITNGELITGDSSLTCETFSKDSRSIEPQDTYIGMTA